MNRNTFAKAYGIFKDFENCVTDEDIMVNIYEALRSEYERGVNVGYAAGYDEGYANGRSAQAAADPRQQMHTLATSGADFIFTPWGVKDARELPEGYDPFEDSEPMREPSAGDTTSHLQRDAYVKHFISHQ